MGRPSKRHSRIVARVLEAHPEARTAGFRRAVQDAVPGLIEEDIEDLAAFRLRPDAFVVNPEQEEVVIFEVEETSPVSREALERWTDLWFVLDCMSWELRLIRIDRAGLDSETCLVSHWYQRLAGQAEEARAA